MCCWRLAGSNIAKDTHTPETGARKLGLVFGAGISRQLQNFWRQKQTLSLYFRYTFTTNYNRNIYSQIIDIQQQLLPSLE